MKKFTINGLGPFLMLAFIISFMMAKSQEKQLELIKEDSLKKTVLSNSAIQSIPKIINFTDSIADIITHNSKTIDCILNIHNQQNRSSFSNKYSVWYMFIITCAIFLGTMIYYWVSYKSQKRQFDRQNVNFKEQLTEQQRQFFCQINQQKDQFDKDLNARKNQLEKQLNLNEGITKKQLMPIISGYAIGGKNSKEISFVIENYGGGPAIINSVLYKNLDSNNSNTSIKKILEIGKDFKWDEAWSFTQKKYYLYPQQKRILYKLTLDNIKKGYKGNDLENRAILNTIRDKRNNLLLTIKYKGIYDEENYIYKYPNKI